MKWGFDNKRHISRKKKNRCKSTVFSIRYVCNENILLDAVS